MSSAYFSGFFPQPLAAFPGTNVNRSVDSFVDSLFKVRPPKIDSKEFVVLSGYEGVLHRVPHEQVFTGKVSVSRDTLLFGKNHQNGKADQGLINLNISSENGFSVSVYLLADKRAEKTVRALQNQLANKKPVILYRGETDWMVLFEFPVRIKEENLSKELLPKKKENSQVSGGEYYVRSIFRRPEDKEPEICSFYPYVSATVSETKKVICVEYLTPAYARQLGNQGTLENRPFAPFFDPLLDRLGFQSEEYLTTGKDGNPDKRRYNCYSDLSNQRPPFPLRKPTHKDFENPYLEGLKPFQELPNHLWKVFLERVIAGQFISDFESVAVPFCSQTGVKKHFAETIKSRSSGEIAQLGEIYSGPRDRMAIVGERIIFDVGLVNGKKLFIVDSIRYGVGLYVFTDRDEAVMFCKDPEYRKSVHKQRQGQSENIIAKSLIKFFPHMPDKNGAESDGWEVKLKKWIRELSQE